MAELLIELAVALQKHAIYPVGHPQRGSAVDRLIRRLDGVLLEQSVAFATARTQLVVEGVATDPLNPLTRELAQRLHRQRVGGLRFVPGLPRDELADFLSMVAAEQDAPRIELTAQAERWPHIVVTAPTYDRLEIMGEEGGLAEDEARLAGVKLIWIALARAALLLEDGSEGDELLDPSVLARAIETNGDAVYDASIAGFLMEVTESLKRATGEESATVRARVSDLVRSLRPETLDRLLDLGGDVERRRRLVVDASRQVAAEAVVALVRSAANASGQPISRTMLRLLGKLALQAEQGGGPMRAGANAALRDQVEQIVEGWDAPPLDAERYQRALDGLARRRVVRVVMQRQHPCEAKRVVMTSLEADALGAPVWLAVHQLVSHGGIAMLLDLLDRAPEGNAAAAELWPLVATRENVRHLLREEQVDPALLDRIAARMGMDAVDLLLDALETSETRAMRRKLLDLVARLGSNVGPLVAQRLEADDLPWYVQRNLLTLLGMLPELPQGFVARRFLMHDDARVRREALKLVLHAAPHRDAAIVAALDDRDSGLVRMALTAALDGCPLAAVPLIMRHVERRTLPPEMRALAVRVVGASGASDAVDWLLSRAVSRRSLFRGEKLLPKTPEMLGALSGLALGWRDHPRAAVALALAQRSPDTEVRRAATPRGRSRG